MDSSILLKEILSQEKSSPSPKVIRLTDEWKSFIVGIGNDHTAEILIYKNDYDVLMKSQETLAADEIKLLEGIIKGIANNIHKWEEKR